MPEQLEGRKFYFPVERGFEKTIRERMDYLEAVKKKRK